MSQLSPQSLPQSRGTRLRQEPALVALLGCLLLAGCSTVSPSSPQEPYESSVDRDVYERARTGRLEQAEAEVKRLRADLRQAEQALIATEEALVATQEALITTEQALASSRQALVTTESGLRGQYSRADAVSLVAEARIWVGRAARIAPWRGEAVSEAKMKLDEASRQIQAGHFGSAIFFAGRAKRISDALIEEGVAVQSSKTASYVRGEGVRLRTGPSFKHTVVELLKKRTPVYRERSSGKWVLVRTAQGKVGWIHASLVSHR